MQDSCLGYDMHAAHGKMNGMCTFAAAQQRLQEGDVSGALVLRQDMAFNEPAVPGAVPVDVALCACYDGEVS